MPSFVSLSVISTDILPKVESVSTVIDLRGHLISDSEFNSIVTDGFQAINSLTLTDLNRRLGSISNRGMTSFQNKRLGNITEAHLLMRAQINKNPSDYDVYATTLALYKYRGSIFNEIENFGSNYSKMEKMSKLISRNSIQL